jgi:cytochrome c oxidase cbb3-type subunit 3
MKYGKYFTLIIGLIYSASAIGQATAPAAATPAVNELSTIMTWVLISAASLMIITGFFYMLSVNKFMYKRILTLEAQRAGVTLPEAAIEPDASNEFWDRLRKKYWEDAVPIEQEEQIISHHAFDGIRELDNRLPPWWINMFILTIIWAVGYMYYYHFGGNGPSQKEEYDTEMAKAKQEIALALAGQANLVDESNVTVLADPGLVGQGELIFNSNCVACHGKGLEGLVGPNLTDDNWIHGGGIKNVFKVIKYGVPEKGMISWQAQLKPSDMQKVASYILSKKGSNPPNPKAPQGEVWKEEAPK